MNESTPGAIAVEALEDARSVRWLWWTYLLRDKKAVGGLVVLVILIILAVFASVISPYDPNAMVFDMMESPSLKHPLGTDDLSRDLLSRLIHGTRV